MSSDLEEAAREPIPENQDENTEASSTPEPADAGGERESSEAEEAPSTDEPRPKPRKASQRIGELVALNKAKDAEIARLHQLAQRGTPEPQQDDPEPNRDDFDDFQEFLRAQARWDVRREFKEQSKHQQQEAQKRQASEANAAAQRRWDESHESAIDKYDDYEEIFEVVGTSIDDAQAFAIKDADDPAEVVYYFGKNPKEFAKFKGLSGNAAIKAVGRIEERLSIQREQRSKAPRPVKPVKGTGTTTNALSDDLPMSEWVKRRNKEVYGA